MNQKQKVILATSLATTIFLLVGTGYFFSHYELKFQSPITIKLATPMYWIRRAMAMNITVVQEPNSIPLNANEAYLCQTFGDQCTMALRIQHFENGTEQCDRYAVDNNKTFDTGLMMINSTHIGQVVEGHKITLAELVTCQGNIDDAYRLYKAQGWGIWSTYQHAK